MSQFSGRVQLSHAQLTSKAISLCRVHIMAALRFQIFKIRYDTVQATVPDVSLVSRRQGRDTRTLNPENGHS